MKKTLTALMAALMVIFLCFGLMSCFDDGIVSDKFPDETFEEDWDAAFSAENFENFKVEMTWEYKKSKYGETTERSSGQDIGVHADNKQYLTCESTENGETKREEYYYDISYRSHYYNIDGNWNRSNEDPMLRPMDVYVATSSVFTNAGLYFGEFKYSKADRGYTYEYESDSYAIKYVLKFKDKKVVSYYSRNINYKDDEHKYFDVITYNYIFTYGGQTVTTPEGLPGK